MLKFSIVISKLILYLESFMSSIFKELIITQLNSIYSRKFASFGIEKGKVSPGLAFEKGIKGLHIILRTGIFADKIAVVYSTNFQHSDNSRIIYKIDMIQPLGMFSNPVSPKSISLSGKASPVAQLPYNLKLTLCWRNILATINYILLIKMFLRGSILLDSIVIFYTISYNSVCSFF